MQLHAAQYGAPGSATAAPHTGTGAVEAADARCSFRLCAHSRRPQSPRQEHAAAATARSCSNAVSNCGKPAAAETLAAGEAAAATARSYSNAVSNSLRRPFPEDCS